MPTKDVPTKDVPTKDWVYCTGSSTSSADLYWSSDPLPVKIEDFGARSNVDASR